MSDGKPLFPNEPWPGFMAGKPAPTPEDAVRGLSIDEHYHPWTYMTPMEAPYTVAALLVNPERQVLAVSRKNDHTKFGLPGGKIDPEDGPQHSSSTAYRAMRRELREETGLESDALQAIFQAPCECYNMPLHALTFYVPWWRGTPESREGAITKWVDPSVVMLGPFGEYNAALFEHLRTSFPKVFGWLP